MTEVAENTSATESVASESVSMFTETGEFAENWMETAGIAEDLRGNQTLKTTKTVASMASQLVNAQKMIGQGPNMALMPTEKSTEAEWGEFHDRFRPDTPADYAIAHHEDAGEIDEAAEAAFKDLAHAEGLRPSTVQKLSDMYEAKVLAARQSILQGKADAMSAAETALKEKWGVAFDERKNMANKLISDNVTDEENQSHIVSVIGNDPVVADFLATIQKKSFSEHRVIEGDTGQPTPVEAIAAAEALQNTPGYISGELATTSPARYAQIKKEIGELYAKAYPEKKAS